MAGTVIVGAGHAGIELAAALRARDDSRPITVLTREAELPYHRPPLSKDYLTATSPQPLPLRGADFYGAKSIDLRRHVAVTEIQPEDQEIRFDDNAVLHFDDLVLATGSRNRQLNVPGADGPGVCYLRTAEDAAVLAHHLEDIGTVVVVGAGFIGLEFAAAAEHRGIEVTVVEYGQRPMARVLSEQTTTHVLEMHRASGIDFLFGASVTGILRGERGVEAVVVNGQELPTDLVVVGIGAEPVVDLAAAASISTADGFIVDEYLRTEDEHIWAIGDCARFPCAYTGGRVRRESVQNANDQARALAMTLSGIPTKYTDLPWFWSHQGQCKIQIAGVGDTASHTVTRRDDVEGALATFCFNDDEMLIAVETVNQPRIHLAARKALIAPRTLTVSDLERAQFDLRAALTQCVA